MNNHLLEANTMKTNNLKRLLTILFLASLVLSACGNYKIVKTTPTGQASTQADAPSKSSKGAVIAEGHIEPKDFRTLSFPMAGRVGEVLVKKGDSVTSGQTLARLENSEDLQARLAATRTEMTAAQQNLDDLQRTTALNRAQASINLVKARQTQSAAQIHWDAINVEQTRNDIETAKTNVADAEKDLNNAKTDFEPYKDLPTDNEQRQSAQSNLDDAQSKYDQAAATRDDLVNNLNLAAAELDLANQAVTEAQYQYDQLANGTDPQALELANARLEAARLQNVAAQAALDNLNLKAPMDGTILDVKVIKNDLTDPASWVILLADSSEWYVRTSDLTELEVVKIDIGQTTVSVPDALPDLSLKGVVEEISQTFTQKTGDVLYDVRVRLTDNDPRLRWGMTVATTFIEK
jgi:multidrug resistance efflux pump